MKKAILYCVFALIAAAAAVLGFNAGKLKRERELAAASPVVTASETVCPTELRTEDPTDDPNPFNTPEPIPGADGEFLTLVNITHPIASEPKVALLSEILTAGNVTCDSRRHANETAARALNDMLLAAQGEGSFEFIIASAFRSIDEQDVLWRGRLSWDPEHGSDPTNRPLKVMPTYCSEHTTGLAFDILCASCPHSDISFAYTPEGIWLRENSARFGFILRYPEDKQSLTCVQYEPWHFRYVGVEAAEYMFEHGLCLEEYLELIGR